MTSIQQYGKQAADQLATATQRGQMSPADFAKLAGMGPKAGVVTGVQAYHNANQALAHATQTDIAFNTHINGPVGDPGVHSTTVNNARFIATRAGWWRLDCCLFYAANAVGVRMLSIIHSGLTVAVVASEVPAAAGGNLTAVAASMTAYYALGAYARAQGYQDSGAPLNVLTGVYYSPAATWTFVGD